MSKIKTKVGTLVSETVGVDGDYPGIIISLKKENGDMIYDIAVIEYDEVKEVLQCIIYNDENDTDSPSDIIELNNVMKNL